jgi:hypothetical protein
MSRYDAVAARVLAQITKYGEGQTVKFPGAAPGTYDPLTNTWSAGGPSGDVHGKAVKVDGDPDTLAALDLIGVDNVTLLVALPLLDDDGTAVPESTFAPNAPALFVWPENGGRGYTIKSKNDVAPSGPPILYELVGAV